METGQTGENYEYGVNRLGYLYDGRGSNAEFRYDSFGAVISDVGQEPIFGYNGESYNPATELQYLRARYYDSSTANFTTQDGFFGETQIPTSFNRYSYAFNDPINLSDPTGEFPSFGNFLNGAKNALKSLVNGGKNTINSIVDIAKKFLGFNKKLALDIVSALKKKFIDPIIISELSNLIPWTTNYLAQTKVEYDNESDENKKSALRTRFLELEARHRELCDQARKVGLQPNDIGYTIDEPMIELDIPVIGQETGAWCWIAVAMMMASHYSSTLTHSQREMAELIKGGQIDAEGFLLDADGNRARNEENQFIRTFGSPEERIEALTIWLGVGFRFEIKGVLSQDEIKYSILCGNPISVTRGWYLDDANRTSSHVWLITAYDNEFRNYRMQDPGPVGEGSMYWWDYETIVDGRSTDTDIGRWERSVVLK